MVIVGKDFIYILIALGVFLLLSWFLRKFKLPKVGSMAMVTGGVKTGKTTFAVGLAVKNYKSTLRKVKFLNFFRKIFFREPLELPLLYSNIPLCGIDYVPLTKSLLLRNSRFAYRSVILVSEASLVADSQLIKDKELNDNLLLFNKLIGHETKGGCIIYDTQCISDIHYSIKRCLSEYFYIHHINKFIPFFILAYVKEDRYSEDGSVISVQSDDVETNLKKVLIPKKTWKYFDCYCYSSFTDNLPVCDNVKNLSKYDSLKCTDIVSFKERFNNVK